MTCSFTHHGKTDISGNFPTQSTFILLSLKLRLPRCCRNKCEQASHDIFNVSDPRNFQDFWACVNMVLLFFLKFCHFPRYQSLKHQRSYSFQPHFIRKQIIWRLQWVQSSSCDLHFVNERWRVTLIVGALQPMQSGHETSVTMYGWIRSFRAFLYICNIKRTVRLFSYIVVFLVVSCYMKGFFYSIVAQNIFFL